jgi:hypothetical protein
VETPIFDWPYKQGDEFTPLLLGYHSVQGNAIGMHFDCSECHIEVVDSAKFPKLFPVSLWKQHVEGEQPSPGRPTPPRE